MKQSWLKDYDTEQGCEKAQREMERERENDRRLWWVLPGHDGDGTLRWHGQGEGGCFWLLNCGQKTRRHKLRN